MHIILHRRAQPQHGDRKNTGFWVTALEESETTGEPSGPSYATIAITIPKLYKTDAAVFSIKQVQQATATTIPKLFKADAAVFSIKHVHHYAVPV